jgi:adenosine deaminase
MKERKKASRAFINGIPKAELHVHLEGTIEPELLFALAERNQILLPYQKLEEVNAAYQFKDLRDFLTIYNKGTKVLRKPEDFYDVAMAYFNKCQEQNVLHSELFIDFQTYTKRNISPGVQMEGLTQARKDAFDQWGVSSELILCFLRHLGPEAAMKTLEQALNFREELIGIGLASTENGYPPELFTAVFSKARASGFKLVAHAGEEGPWEYVQNSMDYLKVDRIDHGNRSCQNEDLVKRIIEEQIPLTLCPLSNIKLKNVDRIENHTIKKMLDRNMMITINSDDPAYFGGYVNENYQVVVDTFELEEKEVLKLARNSILASFASTGRKETLLKALDQFVQNWPSQ